MAKIDEEETDVNTIGKSITFQKDVFDKLELVRGDVPRSTYVNKVLKKEFKIV